MTSHATQRSRRLFCVLSPMSWWRPGPKFGLLPFGTSGLRREPEMGGPSGGAERAPSSTDRAGVCLTHDAHTATATCTGLCVGALLLPAALVVFGGGVRSRG